MYMKFRVKSISIVFLVSLLFSFVAFSGLTPSDVRALSHDGDDDDDADVPQFARGLMDKEEYMRLRDEYLDRLRGLPYAGAAGLRASAIQQMEAQERNSPDINSATWDSIGPAPIPTASPVSGRVSAIAIHPTNPNIVYVGAAQGGVYRSLDGGVSWRAIFDSAQSLAIGAIAIAPSSPTTVFVGTGEPNGSCDSYSGVGVYRIDNADTVPVLNGPYHNDGSAADVMTGRSVGKIVVHPTDPNTIFVSTAAGIGGIGCDLPSAQPSRGVFRSTNAMSGSVTFTKLTVATANSGNRSSLEVVMEPGNPANLLVTVNGFNGAGDGGVYRSTNALDTSPTFTRTLLIGNAGPSTIRSQLAIQKTGSTTTVYCASGEASGAATCGTQGTLRKSTDGGATWTTPIAAGNGFCGGQCFYNVSLAVDPNNASNVLLGGNVSGSCTKLISRSTDGGTTFTNVSTNVHADNHVAAFAPSNSSIAYMGTDGGIYKSTNGGAAWSSINIAGFNATQFQSIALHPTDREFMIGGTQDNGTEYKHSDGTWTNADGGDGGFALIDQGAVNTTAVTMYHTYFNQGPPNPTAMAFASVSTTAQAFNGGWTVYGCGFSGVLANGLSCGDSAVNFYAPMALGPGTPNTVYFGSDRLYRSINAGVLMTVVSQQFAAGVPVSAIGISPQNDNARIVGLNNGKVFATTTGANPMTDVTGSIPARYVARAVIDPTNINTAYVTLAGFGLAAAQHVWKTTNLNNATPTWTASGNGIPDIPVNAFVVDSTDSTRLYAGTDIGVYRSTNSGANWAPFGTGLPRVAVFGMAIQSTFKVLRIATHGRGIWEISTSPFSLDAFYKSFPGNTVGNGTVSVTGPNGPAWTAATTDSWIHITNSGPGTGNGAVTYTVDINPSSTTNRSGTITIASQTYKVYQGAAFLDVNPGDNFYNEIGRLSARGVTLGDGAGHYSPAGLVTREQMAAFIERALGDTNPPTPPSQRFLDVPPSNAFYAFIEQLAQRQITLGCGGGNYCPADSVLREQMAAFIIRGLGEFSPPTPGSQRFGDVPPANPFYNFIDRMAVLNITLGCQGGMPPLYCPGDTVTRAQMAAFLVRAFNL